MIALSSSCIKGLTATVGASACTAQRPLMQRLPTMRLHRLRAAPEDAGEDLSGLLKDLEKFQQRSSSSSGAPSAGPSANAAASGNAAAGGVSPSGGAAPSSFKETLDKVLIADFFFVLIVLAWLAAGLGLQAMLHTSALLDAWFPLWPLVFQPAIGVLMLGALVSGGLNWLKEQEQNKGA